MKSLYNKIKLIIKKAFTYYKIKKETFTIVKSIIIDKSNYLESGRYSISQKSPKIIYKKNTKNKNFLNNYINHLKPNLDNDKAIKYSMKFKMKKLILSIINRTFNFIYNIKIKNKGYSNNDFSATLIIIMRGQKRIKLVDSEKDKVISFENSEKLNAIELGYKKFNPYFSTPIEEINHNEKYIKEKLIDYIPHKYLDLNDKVKIYESILKKLKNRYCDETSNYKSIKLNCKLDSVYKNYENGQEIKQFTETHIDKSLLNKKIPLSLQHHDLVFSNLLYTKDDLYLIDFETTQTSLFFVDIFRIFCEELKRFGTDSYLLSELKNGKFNKEINEIFELFNFYFNPKLTKDYIIITFILLWNNVRDSEKDKVYKQKDANQLDSIKNFF